jgi:hypothetical protein
VLVSFGRFAAEGYREFRFSFDIFGARFAVENVCFLTFGFAEVIDATHGPKTPNIFSL